MTSRQGLSAWFLVLVSTAAAAMEPDQLPPDLQKTYKKAVSRLQSDKGGKQAAEILEQLDLVAAGAPDCYKAQFLRGELHSQARRFEEALGAYQEVVRAKPSSALGQLRVGLAQLELGRAEEGLASIQAALALQPSFPEAQLALARAQTALGRHDEALVSVKAAEEQGAGKTEAKALTAAILIGKGEDAKAEELLLKALQQHPKDAGLWFNLGVAQEHLDRDTEAVKSWKTAVSLDPDCLGAHKNLGILHHTRNEFKQAAECYTRFFERGGKDEKLKEISDRLSSMFNKP